MSKARREVAKALPVIIRVEGKKEGTKTLFAAFPTEYSDTTQPYSMECYSIGDGHGGCDPRYIREGTTPATQAQVRQMLARLKDLGYPPLRVIQRQSSAHLAERVRKYRAKYYAK